ncbi:MAG: type II toxin-antitoxin system VapC family toxin [Blastocatellia bacterium]
MGSLTLPSAGVIYLDTSPFIYTVEKHTDFYPLLEPLWVAAELGRIEVASSELSLLETLVGPLKQNDTALVAMYEQTLTASDVRLISITEDLLRQAARVRAQTNLKTPDAIHAATALASGCAQFITNDPAFRRVTGLNVVVLSDLI